MRKMQNHLHFNSLGSTNVHLKQMVESSEKGLEALFTITADQQENGRGRQQKTWESECGKNLLMSVLLYPQYPPQKQFYVCRYVSLALVDFLQELLQDTSKNTRHCGLDPQSPCRLGIPHQVRNDECTKNVYIKYPNDIYIGNQKVAGILIEHFLQGEKINYSIAGIGLNVNQAVFPAHLPNPTSIFLETNKEFSPFFCMEKIVENIKELSAYKPAVLEQKYEEFLYKKDEYATFLIPQQSDIPIVAKINGVIENGLLHLSDTENNSFFVAVNEIVYL